MEKIITCTKCWKTFTVSGPYSSEKEVAQGVTCPFCGELNDVKWPMDTEFTAIPKKPSASIPANNAEGLKMAGQIVRFPYCVLG